MTRQDLKLAIQNMRQYAPAQKQELLAALEYWPEEGLDHLAKVLKLKPQAALRQMQNAVVAQRPSMPAQPKAAIPSVPPAISNYNLADILEKARLRSEAGLEIHEDDARFIVALIKSRRQSYE